MRHNIFNTVSNIIFILVILGTIGVIAYNIWSAKSGKHKEGFENVILNQDNQIVNNNLDLFDDTVVRIKCNSINFNWLEPYRTNGSNESIGTGFFINDLGHILTNYHVIQNHIKVYIQIPKLGSQNYTCEVISINPKLDLAILKCQEYTNKKFLKLGDSDTIKKGDKVMAIGYPLGQDRIKITSGVISGYQDGDIQTDSAINPGNSGGPLIHDNTVVGINYARNEEGQNVGYAIPIDYFKVHLEDMLRKPKINFPIYGATFNNSNETLMKVKGGCPTGYYISKVFPNGSMDRAGVKEGDILCELDGYAVDNYGEIFLEKLKTQFHISDYLNYKKVGDKF